MAVRGGCGSAGKIRKNGAGEGGSQFALARNATLNDG